MAQQGGTWDPKKIRRQQIELAKRKERSSEPSQEQKLVDNPSASHSQDNNTDGQEWDIVKNSIDQPESEPEPHRDGVSSKFNFQVGWGKWKMDLFNWDVNVRKAARQTEEVASPSSSSTENKGKNAKPSERE